MTKGRREFIASSAAAAATALFVSQTAMAAPKMHGLIGRMIAAEGKRDELLAILQKGTTAMPGCLIYVIAKDPSDANSIWITEVWDSKESHAASLKIPAVREAISKARPLIAGFKESFTTEPVGGVGLGRK